MKAPELEEIFDHGYSKSSLYGRWTINGYDKWWRCYRKN